MVAGQGVLWSELRVAGQGVLWSGMRAVVLSTDRLAGKLLIRLHSGRTFWVAMNEVK